MLGVEAAENCTQTHLTQATQGHTNCSSETGHHGVTDFWHLVGQIYCKYHTSKCINYQEGKFQEDPRKLYSPLYPKQVTQSRHLHVSYRSKERRRTVKGKGQRKAMREGKKKQNCYLTYGDSFSLSFNFPMWGLRKLHSVMPQVLLHFKNICWNLFFLFLN